MKKFVLNHDAASLDAALQVSDQTDVLFYSAFAQPPLFVLAVERNFVDGAKLLLRAKADVNQRFGPSGTALTCAVICGHEQMVELLLAQPEIAPDVVVRGGPALAHAVEHGHTRIVQHLLIANATIGNLLCLAARVTDGRIVELLLQHKAPAHVVDFKGDSALHIAAAHGRVSAVALLLNAKANIDLADASGCSALMRACNSTRLTSVQQQGARPDAFKRATLVDALLTAGANPNATDATGRTALSLAALADAHSMPSLLNAKADCNLADQDGKTPLLCAVAGRNVRAAKLLLDHGALVWKKAEHSAKQMARSQKDLWHLFACTLCGWEGMCCPQCRKTYCVVECDKFTGQSVG